MKLYNILTQIIIGLVFMSCNDRTEVKVKKVKLNPVSQDTIVPIPLPPNGLKVSAYLMFDDGSISTFDVLNDKSIALWNTIIGAGDALKPSHKIKVILIGRLDRLNIKITNGKKKIIDEKLPNLSGNFEYIIKNTGCEEVVVNVTRNRNTVYENNIPFKCGE